MLFNEFKDIGVRTLEFAFKGKGARAPSEAEVAAEKAQKKELADLQRKEDAKVKAMGRKKRGRASLISGEETGLKENLGA